MAYKNERTLIGLCPPASLPATPNGIHVLCLIPTMVEKSSALWGTGSAGHQRKYLTAFRAQRRCRFIKLLALHCQVAYNEASPLHVPGDCFPPAHCVVSVSVSETERRRKNVGGFLPLASPAHSCLGEHSESSLFSKACVNLFPLFSCCCY